MKIPKRREDFAVYKLDNCPFCEGVARLIRKRPLTIKEEEKHVCYVKCTECFTRTGFVIIEDFDTIDAAWDEAVNRWNKRVSSFG